MSAMLLPDYTIFRPPEQKRIRAIFEIRDLLNGLLLPGPMHSGRVF